MDQSPAYNLYVDLKRGSEDEMSTDSLTVIDKALNAITLALKDRDIDHLRL
jgi:hypothetical protein